MSWFGPKPIKTGWSPVESNLYRCNNDSVMKLKNLAWPLR